MNIKYLVSFLTVAEEKSINTAASRLFISPSALMKQINSVEEYVGTTLLYRGKKGVRLTEAGTVFRQGLEELLPAYEELLKKTKAAGHRESSAIIVGSWSVACHSIIPQMVNYYRIRFPQAKLVFRNLPSIGDMQRALEQKEIDVTFSFGGRSRATAKLRHIVLAKEEPILLIPPTCDIPFKDRMSLEDLNGRILVITDGSLSKWFDQFGRYVETRYPQIRLHRTLENEAGLMDMQTLAAPCVASRSIIPRDRSYVAVPLILPEDYEDPCISIDLVCRDEDEQRMKDFIHSAEEVAKVIWFSRI